jgi:DNA-3-methyladenine glycosylase II
MAAIRPVRLDVAPATRSLGEAEFERARRHLMRCDPRLAPIIRRVGRCRLPDASTRAPFAALVRAILSQQLSGKAAATIHGRVEVLLTASLALPLLLFRCSSCSRQSGLLLFHLLF